MPKKLTFEELKSTAGNLLIAKENGISLKLLFHIEDKEGVANIQLVVYSGIDILYSGNSLVEAIDSYNNMIEW